MRGLGALFLNQITWVGEIALVLLLEQALELQEVVLKSLGRA